MEGRPEPVTNHEVQYTFPPYLLPPPWQDQCDPAGQGFDSISSRCNKKQLSPQHNHIWCIIRFTYHQPNNDEVINDYPLPN